MGLFDAFKKKPAPAPRIFSTDKKGREKIDIEERFRSFLFVKREEK